MIGKPMSDWTEDDVWAWVASLKGLKKNTKSLLREKAREVMRDHHTSMYPIPDECPIVGDDSAGCPYPFNGTMLISMKESNLLKKAGWEDKEILITRDAALVLFKARDKYIDQWLELNEDLSAGEEPKEKLVYVEPEFEPHGQDASYDGKQMTTFNGLDVQDWLKLLDDLSDDEKADIAKKFKEIKMDEALQDDDSPGPQPFDGNDLLFLKPIHIRMPASWEKTKFVLSESVTNTLISKRDAYRKSTEDPADAIALTDPNHYKNKPMWDCKCRFRHHCKF